jgi:transcriptional regulator with XRE-family HTH domain
MNTAEKLTIRKEFGKRLKKIRESKDLSIRDFAHLADMDHMQIERYEKGQVNPTLTNIIRLAKALEIDPCSLISPDR